MSSSQENSPEEEEVKEEETKPKHQNPPQEQAKEIPEDDTKMDGSSPPYSVDEEFSPILRLCGLLSPPESDEEANRDSTVSVLDYPPLNNLDDLPSSPPEPQLVDISGRENEYQGMEPYLERLSNDVETRIAFLMGILDYYTQHQVFPFEDPVSFKDFIESWLQVNVSEGDLKKVIYKMRKKYVKTSVEVGKKIIAPKSCDWKEFELGHKIWSAPRTEFYFNFYKKSAFEFL